MIRPLRTSRVWVCLAIILVAVLLGMGALHAATAGTRLPAVGLRAADTPTPAPPVSSLIIEPQDGVEPVLDLLNGARRSIRMKMYLMTNPDVVNALKEAAGRGVRVQVMLELNPYGGGSGNVDVATELQEGGVEVGWDSPAFHFSHEKSIVVDDRLACLLTANMTSSSFTANREYGVILRDRDLVAEIARVFDADWNREPVDLTGSRLVWAPDNARERILELFGSAQATLVLEEQSMQDEEIIQALLQAADRGVRVRLISSPHYPLEEDTDEPGRQRLREGGVGVRYLDDPYIHAKVFVVDGKAAFVGSQNLTTNSLDFNRELGIVLEEPALVQAIQDQFEADWAAATEEAFPTAGLDLPEGAVISHQEAKKYLYNELTVELTVRDVYNSGRVIWLMPDADWDANFKVVIFPSDWGKWSQRPDLLYMGKTIRVSGLIEVYRGWPEIIVNDPSQVEIVERLPVTGGCLLTVYP